MQAIAAVASYSGEPVEGVVAHSLCLRRAAEMLVDQLDGRGRDGKTRFSRCAFHRALVTAFVSHRYSRAFFPRPAVS